MSWRTYTRHKSVVRPFKQRMRSMVPRSPQNSWSPSNPRLRQSARKNVGAWLRLRFRRSYTHVRGSEVAEASKVKIWIALAQCSVVGASWALLSLLHSINHRNRAAFIPARLLSGRSFICSVDSRHTTGDRSAARFCRRLRSASQSRYADFLSANAFVSP